MERPPAVAGRYYPDDARALSETVERLLGPDRSDDPAVAAVVPHASFRCSGGLAGAVFARLRVPPTVVLLGPDHTGPAARSAIMTHGLWRIPNGYVPIDGPVAEDFRRLALLSEDHRAHRDEHALEVQLPFLVQRNPKVRIVPVAFGDLPYTTCARVGSALADVVTMHGRDVLIVASTDLSHYLRAPEAYDGDQRLLARIRDLDAKGLYDEVAAREATMCGCAATAVALSAAKALGASGADVVGYEHSAAEAEGDAVGVGYAGCVIR